MGLRSAFFGFYRFAKSVIAPKLEYSQTIYEQVLSTRVSSGELWMDLGCGHELLPTWRFDQEKELVARAAHIVGVDPDFDALSRHRSITSRVLGDASKLPFAPGRFSLVTSNMVFEHLQEPQVQLKEIFATLQPGGTLMFHTPNKFGYGVVLGRLLPDRVKIWLAAILQDRKAEDVYPAFYRINSEARIRELAAQAGFEVSEVKLIVTSPILTMVPPLVIFELLWLRLLMTRPFRPLRTNIIGILRKPASSGAA